MGAMQVFNEEDMKYKPLCDHTKPAVHIITLNEKDYGQDELQISIEIPDGSYQNLCDIGALHRSPLDMKVRA